MIIEFTLKNDRTGKIETATVDDGCSPTGGYTQAYADRTGAEYAASRAKEKLNTTSYPDDTWTFVRAQYQPIPHFKKTVR